MDYFSSDVFKVSLFLVAFFVVYGVVIYLMKEQIIKYILAQPDEKKLKLYQGFSKIMPLYKHLFWMLHISLVLTILRIFSRLNDTFFFMISLQIVMYVGLLVTFLFVKIVLKASDES